MAGARELPDPAALDKAERLDGEAQKRAYFAATVHKTRARPVMTVIKLPRQSTAKQPV